jgi:probable rRNA maturation factor
VTPAARNDITVDVQKAAAGWKLVAGAAPLVRKVARQTLAMANVPVLKGASVAVLLADDARVRDVNRQWRATDKPTNVLSFPGAAPDRISQSPYLGDIILAYETVAAEAAAEAKPLPHHVAHLVAHGVLHLLGYDHMTKADAERMETVESAILATLDIPDPYAGSDPLETGTE